jgi:hypothetical protein
MSRSDVTPKPKAVSGAERGKRKRPPGLANQEVDKKGNCPY